MRFRLPTLMIITALGPPTVWTLYIFWKFDSFDTGSVLILSLWTIASALAVGCTLDGIGWLLRRKPSERVRRPSLNLKHDRLRARLIVLALGPPIVGGTWIIGRQLARALMIRPPSAAAYNFLVDPGGGVEPAQDMEMRAAIKQSRERAAREPEVSVP